MNNVKNKNRVKNFAVGVIVLSVAGVAAAHAYKYATLKADNKALKNELVAVKWQANNDEVHYHQLLSSKCQFTNKLNAKQRQIFDLVNRKIEDPALKSIVLAMGMDESDLGINTIRVNSKKARDTSFGVWQKVVYWQAKKENWGPLRAGQEAQRLNDDHEYALEWVIRDLEEFRSKHGGTHYGALFGYNGGTNPTGDAAKQAHEYATKRLSEALEIAQCF